ncbi:cytochrome P450 [Penicillium capsulatum]|uniref:Cytochrome P450 n=1 Tax=Penicillium capsulatum TaxID=69766 RepID=A0A9W9LVY8_9EURO|nr:cytochrome P450 [Penicillium capsulatum]KAJ6122678.1 cytochrome P450 [Penicillium capsulatum]
MGHDYYVVQGSDNVLPLLKQRSLSGFLIHGLFLHRVFGLPKSAAQRYDEDDSGEYTKPGVDSNVEPRNRMNHLTRRSFTSLLNGPGLTLLGKKLEGNLTGRLLSIHGDYGWTHGNNFLDIFETEVTSAVIDSICGPYLLRESPDFTKDLWTVDHNVLNLIFRLPWFITSKAHAAQSRGLAAIKRWYAWAQENFDPGSVSPEGDDPYWGTTYFRELLAMFAAVDGFDATGVASEVFAFIWGSNTNAIISAFWACLEVFRDPELLEEIRREATSCMIKQTGSDLRFDIPRLLQQPVMQAVFAETLRLRIHGFVMRASTKNDIVINEWKIPKNQMVLMSSTPGHMSPSVWCSGPGESRPVETFWPGRFLHYSDKTHFLEFSMKKAQGAWMPFGGSHHPCPGRHFSKLEIILTIALLTTTYDCEILARPENLQMSPRNFGLGVLGPAKKVPFRIRRRGSFTTVSRV